MSKKKLTTGFISFSDVVSDNTSAQLQSLISSTSSNEFSSTSTATLSSGSVSSSSSTASISAGSLSPMYTGPDQDLSLACKRVVKKDLTTRLKGFQEMNGVIQAKGIEILPLFLPHFFFLYTRYFLDDSPKVRVQFNWILYQIVSTLVAAGKDDSDGGSGGSGGGSAAKRPIAMLTEYIPHVIAYWWFAICDHTDNEISVLTSLAAPLNSANSIGISAADAASPKGTSEAYVFAKRAFELTFPLKQRAQVLFRFSAVILLFLEKNIQQNIDNIGNYFGGSSNELSKEFAEERLERLMSVSLSSLLIMMRYFQNVKSEFNSKLTDGVFRSGQEHSQVAVVDVSASSSNLIGYRDIINSSFWKKISNKFQKIRESAYDLSSFIFESMPHLVFSNISPAAVESSSTEISATISSSSSSTSGSASGSNPDAAEMARRLTSIIVASLGNESVEANMTKCIQNIIHFMRFLKRKYDQDCIAGSPDPVVMNSCNLIFDGIHAFAAKILNSTTSTNSSSSGQSNSSGTAAGANIDVDALKLQSILDQMLLVFAVFPNVNINYLGGSSSSSSVGEDEYEEGGAPPELKISMAAEKALAFVGLVHQHFNQLGYSSGFANSSSSSRDLHLHNLSMVFESCTYLLLQKTVTVDLGSNNNAYSNSAKNSSSLESAAAISSTSSSKPKKNKNNANTSSASSSTVLVSSITCSDFKSRILSIIFDLSAHIVGFLVENNHSKVGINAVSAPETSLVDFFSSKRSSQNNNILHEMLSSGGGNSNDLDMCLRSLGQLNRYSMQTSISGEISQDESKSSLSGAGTSAPLNIHSFWRDFNSMLTRRILAAIQPSASITTQNFSKFASSLNTALCLLNEVATRSSSSVASDGGSRPAAAVADFPAGTAGSFIAVNNLCFDLCHPLLATIEASRASADAADMIKEFSHYQSVMLLLYISLQMKCLWVTYCGGRETERFDRSYNVSRLIIFETDFFSDFFAFIDRNNNSSSSSSVVNLRLLNKVIDASIVSLSVGSATKPDISFLLERLLILSCKSYSGQCFVCKLIGSKFPDYFISNEHNLSSQSGYKSFPENNSNNNSNSNNGVVASLDTSVASIIETCNFLLVDLFGVRSVSLAYKSSQAKPDLDSSQINSSKNITNFSFAINFVLTCFQLFRRFVKFAKKSNDQSSIAEFAFLIEEIVRESCLSSDNSATNNISAIEKRRKINRNWLILSSLHRLGDLSKLTSLLGNGQINDVVFDSILHLMFEEDYFRDEGLEPSSSFSLPVDFVCNLKRLTAFMFSHNLTASVIKEFVCIMNKPFGSWEKSPYTSSECLIIFDKFIEIFGSYLMNASSTPSSSSPASSPEFLYGTVLKKLIFLTDEFWSTFLRSSIASICSDGIGGRRNYLDTSISVSDALTFLGGVLSMNQRRLGYLNLFFSQNSNVLIHSLFLSKIFLCFLRSNSEKDSDIAVYSECLSLIGGSDNEGANYRLTWTAKSYSEFVCAMLYVSKIILMHKNRMRRNRVGVDSIVESSSSSVSVSSSPMMMMTSLEECITSVMLDVTRKFVLLKDDKICTSSQIQSIPQLNESLIQKGTQVGYLKIVGNSSVEDDDIIAFGDFMMIRVREYDFQPAVVKEIHITEGEPSYYTIQLRNPTDNGKSAEVQTVANRLYAQASSTSSNEMIHEIAKLTTSGADQSEEEEEAEFIVFVYGSLRKGLENSGYLKGAQYIGLATTSDEFHLTGLKSLAYPFLTRERVKEESNHPAVNIVGELYRINSSTLRELDDLEGYKEGCGPNENDYSRIRINVVACDGSDEFEVFCYLLENESLIAEMKKCMSNDVRYVSVPNGDWRDFKRHYMHENSTGLEDVFDFNCELDAFLKTLAAGADTLPSSSSSQLLSLSLSHSSMLSLSDLQNKCAYVACIIQILKKEMLEDSVMSSNSTLDYSTLQIISSCYQNLLNKLSDWLLPRISGLNYGRVNDTTSSDRKVSGDCFSGFSDGLEELVVFSILLKTLNAILSNFESYSLNSNNICMFLLCEKVKKTSSTFLSCIAEHLSNDVSTMPLGKMSPSPIISEIVLEILKFCSLYMNRHTASTGTSSATSNSYSSLSSSSAGGGSAESDQLSGSECVFEFVFIALASIHSIFTVDNNDNNPKTTSKTATFSAMNEVIMTSFIECCINLWEKMAIFKSGLVSMCNHLDWQLYALSWAVREVIDYSVVSSRSSVSRVSSRVATLAVDVILTALKCQQTKLFEEYFLTNLANEKSILDIILSSNDVGTASDNSLLLSIKFALSCLIDCCFSFEDNKYLSKLSVPTKTSRHTSSKSSELSASSVSVCVDSGTSEDMKLLNFVLGDQLFSAFSAYEVGVDSQNVNNKGIHALFMNKNQSQHQFSSAVDVGDDELSDDFADETSANTSYSSNIPLMSDCGSIMRYFLVYMLAIRKIDFVLRMFDKDSSGLDQAILSAIYGSEYLEQKANASIRDSILSFLKSRGYLAKFVENCMKKNKGLHKINNVSGILTEIYSNFLINIRGNERKSDFKVELHFDDVLNFGSYLLLRVTLFFPLLIRNIYSSCLNRNLKAVLSNFIENKLRTSIIDHEMQLIDSYIATGASDVSRYNEKNPSDNDSNTFVVRTSPGFGEVMAIFNHSEDSKLSIKISFPANYPLSNVSVDFPNKIGMREEKFNKWKLQILILCNNISNSYNRESVNTSPSGVLNACIWWKCNLEKEFEGIEPCPICYSIIHISSSSNNSSSKGASTSSLPSMQCHTCNNKFHSQCLKQWFQSSGKSKCVICQQPFFT